MNKKTDHAKEAKTSCLITGIVFVALAVLFVVVAIAADMMPIIILSFLFAPLAVAMFAMRSKLIKESEKAAESGGEVILRAGHSSMTAAQNKQFEKSRQKCEDKMHNHGGIREVMVNRVIYMMGGILAFITVINILAWFMGRIYIMGVIVNVCMVGVFIASLSPNKYRKALASYKAPICGGEGLDEAAAESEFSEGAVFVHNNVICVGQRFVFGSDNKNTYALDKDRIVWIFPRRQLQYNYTNGIYTGTTENYFMVLCMDDGSVWQFACEKGACPLITDAIQGYNMGIAMGWSEALNEVYLSSAAGFRTEYTKVALPDMYTVQI